MPWHPQILHSPPSRSDVRQAEDAFLASTVLHFIWSRNTSPLFSFSGRRESNVGKEAGLEEEEAHLIMFACCIRVLEVVHTLFVLSPSSLCNT